MTDPLGIVGLLGVVIEITKIGIGFGADLKGAPDDIRELQQELELLIGALTAIQDIGTDPDSKTTNSQATNSSLPLDLKNFGLEKLGQDLNSLCKELEKNARSSQSWFSYSKSRVKSVFLVKRTRQRVEGVRGRCRALYELITVTKVTVIEKNTSELKTDLSKEFTDAQTARKADQEREYSVRRKKILEWLSPINFADRQTDYIRSRESGTGNWLLESEEFTTWTGTKQHTLFCPGDPGAGKTVLAATVVDHLLESLEDSIGMGYIYFNYKRIGEQNIEDLFCSILKQLCHDKSPLPTTVENLYKLHSEKDTRPAKDKILKVLQDVVSSYSKTFLIIDALDECEEQYRLRFLHEIFELQGSFMVKLFATSRKISEIVEQFKGAISMEIRASRDDLQKYLYDNIRYDASRTAKSNTDTIVEKITAKADGIFLLARLYLEAVRWKTSLEDIERKLEELSEASEQVYDRAYEDALDRIKSQPEDFKDLALKVLMWITCAKRQLTTAELRYAIAIREGNTTPEHLNNRLPDVQDILSSCAGILMEDKESKIIRLVHYTAQLYFERSRSKIFSEGHSNISKICITYLTMNTFTDGPCETLSDIEERESSNPFFNYAACNWGHHARESSPPQQEVIDFLSKEVNVQNSAQALMSQGDLLGHELNTSSIKALHLASYFGIPGAVRAFLDEETIEKSTRYNQTPLSLAVRYGHTEAVRILLASGANPNITLGWYYSDTPLLQAIYRGHRDVVELLLDHGADPNCLDESDGDSPLNAAVRQGLNAAAIKMIEKGADVDHRGHHGRTALYQACTKGNEIIVRLLLKKSKDEHPIKDVIDQTPLSLATSGGHTGLIKILLDHGYEEALAYNDQYGRNPISYAAAKGHFGVITALLRSGSVDLTLRDNFGRSALWYARRGGHISIVNALTNYAKDGGILLEDDATCTPPGTKLTLASESSRCSHCRQRFIVCFLCFQVSLEGETYHHCDDCVGWYMNICAQCHQAGARCLGNELGHKLETMEVKHGHELSQRYVLPS